MRSLHNIFPLSAKALLATLVLLLAGCTKPSLDGHVVGNGGDVDRAHLEAGRTEALSALRWVTETRLEAATGAFDTDSFWLIGNLGKVIGEVETVAIQSVPKFPENECKAVPEPWCGCTTTEIGARVNVSKERCPKLGGVNELAELIVHEVLHHFLGADEARVYRVTSRIFKTFRHAKSLSSVSGVEVIYGDEFVKAKSVWDGEAMVAFNPAYHNKFVRFVAGTGWEASRAMPKIDLTEARGESDYVLYSADRKNLYVFFDQVRGLKTSATYQFDLRNSKVYQLEDQGTLSFANEMPWGKARSYVSDKSGFFVVDAKAKAIKMFAPFTRRWTTLNNLPLSDGESYSGVAMSGGHLVLMGGVKGNSAVPSWKLDRYTNIWSKVSTVNAPPKLFNPYVVSTSKGVLVYGGWENLADVGSDEKFLTVGGFYNSATDEWTSIGTDGPRPYKRKLLVQSTDSRVHFVGQQWATWSLAFNTFETVNPNTGALMQNADADKLYVFDRSLLMWSDSKQNGILLPR